jgi:hypothetical protein
MATSSESVRALAKGLAQRTGSHAIRHNAEDCRPSRRCDVYSAGCMGHIRKSDAELNEPIRDPLRPGSQVQIPQAP